MSNPTSNFGWQMPTPTDLVTDLPADFEVFGQAVDTSLADLKGGTTGQILSKTSNTDMDFTWVANDVGDITGITAGTGISGGGTSGTVTITNSMATAFTTSGDLIQATGSGTFARLGTGTSGQYLTTNGTTNSWVTPSSGGSMTSLASGSLTGSSVSLTSINQTYKDLYLVVTGPYFNTNTQCTFRLNNDSTAAYNMKFSLVNDPIVVSYVNYNDLLISELNAGTTANSNQLLFTIRNYAQTCAKNISGAAPTINNSGAGAYEMFASYESSTAISSIQINALNGTSTFSGGTYVLYGVN